MRSVLHGSVALSVCLIAVMAGAQTIERVSVSGDGLEGNGDSNLVSPKRAISADGRYVVFTSLADNLVPDDHNGTADVFQRDRLLGTTVRVSVSSDGGDALGTSENPSMSADGRYVAFQSDAGNIVAGDENGMIDVFVRDMELGQTVRASVDVDGQDPDGNSTRPSMSGDGRMVAFSSSATDMIPGGTTVAVDIYVRDLDMGETIYVSVGHDGSSGNANSWVPEITPDGRFVVFTSGADNLVAGDVYEAQEVFVRDLILGQTVRVSVDINGEDSNARNGRSAISADGNLVAWWSRATDLVADDTNDQDDIFVRDMAAGVTTRVNVSSNGDQAELGGSWHPTISSSGRYVSFLSDAANLVPGDTNGFGEVFVHDRITGLTSLPCVNVAWEQANEISQYPSISADERLMVFQSVASNLAGPDTNGAWDVYLAFGPATVLADGFEAGSVSAWSSSVP